MKLCTQHLRDDVYAEGFGTESRLELRHLYSLGSHCPRISLSSVFYLRSYHCPISSQSQCEHFCAVSSVSPKSLRHRGSPSQPRKRCQAQQQPRRCTRRPSRQQQSSEANLRMLKTRLTIWKMADLSIHGRRG